MDKIRIRKERNPKDEKSLSHLLAIAFTTRLEFLKSAQCFENKLMTTEEEVRDIE